MATEPRIPGLRRLVRVPIRAIESEIGVAFAWVLIHALVTAGPPNIPRLGEISIDQ